MKWQHQIELGKVLETARSQHDLTRLEEDCPAEVKSMIVAEISKAPPLVRFATEINDCKSIAALNRTLDRVYDAADRDAVWCGF